MRNARVPVVTNYPAFSFNDTLPSIGIDLDNLCDDKEP